MKGTETAARATTGGLRLFLPPACSPRRIGPAEPRSREHAMAVLSTRRGAIAGGLQGRARGRGGAPRLPGPRHRQLAGHLAGGPRAAGRWQRGRPDRVRLAARPSASSSSGDTPRLDVVGARRPCRTGRSRPSRCPMATRCATSCPAQTTKRSSASSTMRSTSGPTGSRQRSTTGRPVPSGDRGSSRGSCAWSRMIQAWRSASRTRSSPGTAVTWTRSRFGGTNAGLGWPVRLLADAFERARERGAASSEFSTDSRTGALGLYEHVGMVVTQTWRHWQTDL